MKLVKHVLDRRGRRIVAVRPVDLVKADVADQQAAAELCEHCIGG